MCPPRSLRHVTAILLKNLQVGCTWCLAMPLGNKSLMTQFTLWRDVDSLDVAIGFLSLHQATCAMPGLWSWMVVWQKERNLCLDVATISGAEYNTYHNFAVMKLQLNRSPGGTGGKGVLEWDITKNVEMKKRAWRTCIIQCWGLVWECRSEGQAAKTVWTRKC